MKKINIVLLILFLLNHFYACSVIRKKINTTPITQTKNYKCTLCSKCYSQQANLSRHFNKHKGNIYPCKYCKKPFNRTDNLNRHIQKCPKSNSEINKAKTYTNKPYTCISCKIFFISLSSLNQHLKKFHEKTYPCPQCRNIYFISQHNLDIHTQKFHGTTQQQTTNTQGIMPYTTLQHIIPPVICIQYLILPTQSPNIAPILSPNITPTLQFSSNDSLDALFNM